MRQGLVFLRDTYAGTITEDENGYNFSYDKDYLLAANAESISLTLPLREEPYHSPVLFPFFDGLIPEGWLLNIAERNWKIRRHDRMALLLTCCRDCIGCISVIPAGEEVSHE